MRLIAICFGLLLGIQTASAFECVGVKLPSNLVICSDPELMRIADERQQAFSEARARLTEQQFKVLARAMYWDLMNDVRGQPYVERFKAHWSLKERY